jgi:dTDP-glucose pyrophosphorylase
MQFDKNFVLSNGTIRDAIGAIDSNAKKCAIVVDETGKYVGVVTDGDIRRSLLKGATLDSSIINATNQTGISVDADTSQSQAQKIINSNSLLVLPAIDKNYKVVTLHFPSQSKFAHNHDVRVLLMAGGKGERLRPLTEQIPKPLAMVSGAPILELIINEFSSQGFVEFDISVGYKGEQIRSFFGNGDSRNIEIRYIEEEQPMGTLGAVNLLDQSKFENLIVCNGDLVFKTKLNELVAGHYESDADLTIMTTTHVLQSPYGVIRTSEGNVIDLSEKPEFSMQVNAGIYMLGKRAISLLKNKFPKYANATEFVQNAIDAELVVRSQPITGFWMDIGTKEALTQANSLLSGKTDAGE